MRKRRLGFHSSDGWARERGEPAEVKDRTVLASTDGPIEHARVLCVRNHGFFMPVESLPVLPAPTRPDAAVRRRGSY